MNPLYTAVKSIIAQMGIEEITEPKTTEEHYTIKIYNAMKADLKDAEVLAGFLQMGIHEMLLHPDKVLELHNILDDFIQEKEETEMKINEERRNTNG